MWKIKKVTTINNQNGLFVKQPLLLFSFINQGPPQQNSISLVIVLARSLFQKIFYAADLGFKMLERFFIRPDTSDQKRISRWEEWRDD